MCNSKLPQSEEDLRTISKWLWKVLEHILNEHILPYVDKHLDPGQCGGLKNLSRSHYLVKLMDFVHKALDKKAPHAAVLSVQDLSKAYNRGSHQLVIEDLDAMHLLSWTLSLLCSYLSSRSLGYAAGTLMGGLLFLIKFKGGLPQAACSEANQQQHNPSVKIYWWFVHSCCL